MFTIGRMKRYDRASFAWVIKCLKLLVYLSELSVNTADRSHLVSMQDNECDTPRSFYQDFSSNTPRRTARVPLSPYPAEFKKEWHDL